MKEKRAKVEMRSILTLARKWLWLLLLAGLIGGLAGLAVDLLQSKAYEAQTTLYVSSPNHSDYNTLSGDQQAAKSLALFAQSNPVLTATLQGVGDKSLSLSQLASMVTVDNSYQSQFVIIHVRNNDPNRAARLANEIAKQTLVQFQASVTDGGSALFVQQEMASLETQIQNLERALSNIQAQAAPNTDLTSQTNSINTRINELRTSYSQLAAFYSSLTATKVTILQRAEVPQNPVGLRPVLAMAIGMLVGLISIVGVIVFIEQADDVVRTSAKVVKATGLSTLITVGYLPAIAKRTPQLNGYHEVIANTDTVKFVVPAIAKQAHQSEGDHREVTGDTTRHLPAIAKQAPAVIAGPNAKDKALNGFQLPEEFLTLSVLLSGECGKLVSNGRNIGSLLVTSTEDGDGKTLTASQIALSLARIGVETVLVDANLRKPDVHNLFGLSNRVGLSSLLMSRTIVDFSGQIIDPTLTCLQKTHEPKLAVLPGGPAVDSPTEVLLSPRMTAMLKQLSKKAFVVIDCPAVLTSSEPVILADKCDGILMVVDARRTTASKLNRSLEILKRVNTNILGVVLNQADNQN